jgi:hypothetical protein
VRVAERCDAAAQRAARVIERDADHRRLFELRHGDDGLCRRVRARAALTEGGSLSAGEDARQSWAAQTRCGLCRGRHRSGALRAGAGASRLSAATVESWR